MSSQTIYQTPTGFTVGDLKVQQVIDGLNQQEKDYATYLSLASWAGFPIVTQQISPNSMKIHRFLSEFIKSYPHDKLILATKQIGTPLYYFLEYAATFYYNQSEYLGFGDTKFIPRCSKDELRSIVEGTELTQLLNECIDNIYDDSKNMLQIGYYPEGISMYYEPLDFTQAEVEGINNLMNQKNVRVENTKIIRHDDKYEISIASIEKLPERKIGEFNGKPVVVTTGRHSDCLSKAVHWLELAKENALRENQKVMLDSLIQHYKTGDVLLHEKYSEEWVKDVNPSVETYQGFVESYRDPSGVRCEYESFVAAVNKKESESLHKYVQSSNIILPLLPYPSQYERSTYTPPSYNAIDILTFCTSGMPIGINIPNYDNIRLNIGFKNVTLTNAMSSSANSFQFLTKEENDYVDKYHDQTNNIHVASHELYGHGSGKLFKKSDVVGKNIPDLLTPSETITTYYEEGVSFSSAFGSLASSYEECRAETTALYLLFKKEVLDIFNVPEQDHDNITYTGILLLLHNSMKTLYCYSPEASQWKQAHAAARFAILRACLMWGRGAVQVKKIDDEYKLIVDKERLDDIYIAIEKLLKHLNYYKSACLISPGKEFYRSLTSMDSYWLDIRSYVLKHLSPRSLLCGAMINHKDGKYFLSQASTSAPTTFDVINSTVNNITLSLE